MTRQEFGARCLQRLAELEAGLLTPEEANAEAVVNETHDHRNLGWSDVDTYCNRCYEEGRVAVKRLARVVDYCAGMLAAIDADSSAPDIPGRAEFLEDVLKRARASA